MFGGANFIDKLTDLVSANSYGSLARRKDVDELELPATVVEYPTSLGRHIENLPDHLEPPPSSASRKSTTGTHTYAAACTHPPAR